MMVLRLAIVSLLFLLIGCVAQNPLLQQLPESNFLLPLSEAELYAVHPDGDMVAYVDEGLHLLRLSDGYQQQLTFDSPQALIWTPGGESLVAAFREAEKTRLVSLSGSEHDRPQIFIDEQIDDFAWLADGRLLILAHSGEDNDTEQYLQVSLLIWDGQWDVERIPLYQRGFYKGPAEQRVSVTHRFHLSPLKDELIYNRYIDAPTIGGRVELILYNLNTGRELVLSKTDNRQLRAYCAADGETVLLPDGHGEVKLLNPWTKQIEQRWQAAGEALQIGADQALYYIDGRLYNGKRLTLELPALAKVQFSADGERMFAAWRQKLYLFSGYEAPAKTEFSDLEKAKLQRIRQQRSLGEISIREYYLKRNNILHR